MMIIICRAPSQPELFEKVFRKQWMFESCGPKSDPVSNEEQRSRIFGIFQNNLPVSEYIKQISTFVVAGEH